ncbi:hypothetical protein OGAPHI_006128 [Ogataea philodendri]|uniref:Uncharacterized protein n=1 Tax=Ogataea philodendri TaxID=1378263 RepID=A0A9P8NZK9_9ASCO|nr:uncharacterized protein OGAPHI_006128 [Ogataea philodendri]KAH3661949.1 hypothetical protein OGAPHI_006128 [Ogataea philodendri]
MYILYDLRAYLVNNLSTRSCSFNTTESLNDSSYKTELFCGRLWISWKLSSSMLSRSKLSLTSCFIQYNIPRKMCQLEPPTALICDLLMVSKYGYSRNFNNEYTSCSMDLKNL